MYFQYSYKSNVTLVEKFYSLRDDKVIIYLLIFM